MDRNKPGVARLTLIASGDDRAIAQAVERIRKQVRVLEAEDVTGHNVSGSAPTDAKKTND